jgi:hypothetical protein
MTEQIKKLIGLMLILTLSMLLQSCGGSKDKTPKYTISSSLSSISFSNEFRNESTDTIEITVNFKGNGLLIGFAPDAEPAAWLNYTLTNVTDTTATIAINVINAQFLIANNYTTTLRLSTGDPATPELVNQDIDISLLVWQLDTSTELISFGAVFGSTDIAASTIDITSETNEWTASVDADWLTLDKTEGTGAATITITPNIANLTHAGLYQANLTLTEKTTGDSKSIPVELGLDNLYLIASQPAIAFTQTANVTALEKTITISTNALAQMAWQATSNVDWLQLTAMPESNQLKISVNPNLAPINAQTSAEVTISATNDASVIADTIKIGLYNSDQQSNAQLITPITLNSNAIVNAPSQPITYVAVNNELRAYHQYTGELLSTTAISPTNTVLQQLVMHPDGHLLLAQADETTIDEQGVETTVTHRYKISLNDLSVAELTESTIKFDPVRFVRFSGRYFVVTQTLEYADENLKQLAWDNANAYFARAIDTAKNTQALYALDGNTESFKRYVATINDFTSTKIATKLTHEYHPETLADSDQISSFVVDNNEQNIYLTSPTSEWLSFDGTTFTDNGLLETDTSIITLLLAKTSSGNAAFARFSPNVGFLVNVYDNTQTLLQTISAGTNQPFTMKISSDDKRLVIDATNAQTLSFLPFTE